MTDHINPKDLEWNAVNQRDWMVKTTIDDETKFVDPVREWQRKLPTSSNQYSRDDRSIKPIAVDVAIAMRLTYAAHVLNTLVEIDSHKAGGAPVLAGTRFKIAQIVAELGDGKSISKLARDFDLDRSKIENLLHGIAIYFDRSF